MGKLDKIFTMGQSVIRYMSEEAGYWTGRIVRLGEDTVGVLYGDSIFMSHDKDDPRLFPVTEKELHDILDAMGNVSTTGGQKIEEAKRVDTVKMLPESEDDDQSVEVEYFVVSDVSDEKKDEKKDEPTMRIVDIFAGVQ